MLTKKIPFQAIWWLKDSMYQNQSSVLKNSFVSFSGPFRGLKLRFCGVLALDFRCFGLVLDYRPVRQPLFQQAGPFLIHGKKVRSKGVGWLDSQRLFKP
jgi:hypothetical protein